jgi:peptide subunit release factor 1 (eRF1)
MQREVFVNRAVNQLYQVENVGFHLISFLISPEKQTNAYIDLCLSEANPVQQRTIKTEILENGLKWDNI